MSPIQWSCPDPQKILTPKAPVCSNPHQQAVEISLPVEVSSPALRWQLRTGAGAGARGVGEAGEGTCGRGSPAAARLQAVGHGGVSGHGEGQAAATVAHKGSAGSEGGGGATLHFLERGKGER